MPAALALPETSQALLDRGLWAFELALRNESINQEERSFEAVVASETRAPILDRRTFDIIDEILVAEGGHFPARMPLLPNHRRFDIEDVIGSAVGFRRDRSQWIGKGLVGRAVDGNVHREQLWRDIVDGHIRAVSIGYQVDDFVDIPAGRSQSVAGRKFVAGERTLRISLVWRAHELSITPIGADEQALIRSRTGEKSPQPRSYFAK